jgi:WD40 repeat protein
MSYHTKFNGLIMLQTLVIVLFSAFLVRAQKASLEIAAVDWHPTANWVAVARNELPCGETTLGLHRVIIYDASDYSVLREMSSQECLVNLAFNADGSILATVAANGLVTLWNSSTGESLAEFLGTPSVGSLTWSQHRNLVAKREGTLISLIDADSLAVTQVINNATRVLALDLNPQTDTLAMSDMGGMVRVLNTTNNQDISSNSFDEVVQQVNWDNNGDLLAVVTQSTVTVWDPVTMETPLTVSVNDSRVIGTIWHPTDNLLAVGQLNGTITIWNVNTGESRGSLQSGTELYAFDWSSDGTRFIYGGPLTDTQSLGLTIEPAPTATSTPTHANGCGSR